MTDPIERQAAIDALNNVLADYIPCLIGRNEEIPLECAVAIRELPSAQQWIPCEERLPEEEKAYLVTFANEKVGMSSWHKDTFNRGFNRGFDAYLTGVTEDGECEYFGVVAWMEKPEPWKGGPDEYKKSE